MSELGPMDLLTMRLVSEAVSPAMTGGDASLPGGLVATVTVMGLGVLTSWINYRSRRAEKLITGEAVVLIERGTARPEVMRRFRLTDDELYEALHQHGLLSVDKCGARTWKPTARSR